MQAAEDADEWLPDADALATVLALLRRHKLASVEQVLISELECRADAATRAAVDALSTPAPSDGGGEEGDAPPGPGDLPNSRSVPSVLALARWAHTSTDLCEHLATRTDHSCHPTTTRRHAVRVCARGSTEALALTGSPSPGAHASSSAPAPPPARPSSSQQMQPLAAPGAPPSSEEQLQQERGASTTEDAGADDEYEHDDDCGYHRFEVTHVAAFEALQLADVPGGLVREALTLAQPVSTSTPPAASGSPGTSPRSSPRHAGALTPEQLDAGEWVAARGTASQDESQTAPGAPDAVVEEGHAADVDAGEMRVSEVEASNAEGPRPAVLMPPAGIDDAAHKRNAAMERFFHAQGEGLPAPGEARCSTSSDAAASEAAAPSASAELTLGSSGSPPVLGGGFTFSPVGAPSPPMSLAGFSFRSATGSDDEDGDEQDDDDDDNQGSESSIGRHSALGVTMLTSSPPVGRDSPRDWHSIASADGGDGNGRAQSDGAVTAPGPASTSPASPAHSARGGTGDGGEDGGLEAFELRVVHARHRTGFEEEKDFPITLGSVVAGRYQITEYLGSAAFSRAVQAHDLQTGALVCLKIIKNSKDFFDQSLDEIKLLKLLNAADPGDEHNVLRMFDAFYFKEHLFIATELLRANLYEFQRHNLESGEPRYFTMARLRRVATQVLEALAFVHAQGVLHCDLKPENILFRSFSRCVVKVIDFGSSCFIGDHLSSYVQSRSYRAPEVILGAAYDFRIDVWSVGCILAELHTGRVLFQNDSLSSLLARVAGICGPLPPRLLAARHAHKYFTRSGDVYERDAETGGCFVLRPKACRLAHRLGAPDGVDPDPGFVDLVASLLAVDPESRPTAAEALHHPWLQATAADDD